MRIAPFLALCGIVFAAMTAALAHVQGFDQARCPADARADDGRQPFERFHPPPWREHLGARCQPPTAPAAVPAR
ncbi:MAG: hypothetical protein ACNA7W_16485 [Pseudomonadales bacterium]